MSAADMHNQLIEMGSRLTQMGVGMALAETESRKEEYDPIVQSKKELQECALHIHGLRIDASPLDRRYDFWFSPDQGESIALKVDSFFVMSMNYQDVDDWARKGPGALSMYIDNQVDKARNGYSG